MRGLSIRAKITLWFALAMSALAALTLGCVWMISDNVVQKNIKDSLVEMVSDNVDEVEYYSNKEDANPDGDRDIYIRYKNGYLEIDDDYLDQMNGIYTTLYKEDYELLYGENPIAQATGDVAFADHKLQTLRYKGTTYYVYDRSLKGEGMEDLWLRGIVSRSQGARWMDAIVILSMWLIPLLILLALFGGYFLAGRFLRPIQQMIQAASGIQQGQDLKKRIELKKGQDELHQLADTFNGMMDRLEASFQAEKQFTSDMSHELRTPVAVILSQCELLLEEEQDKDAYADALRLIQRQGKKMSVLINDMLMMTRMEQRRESIRMMQLDYSSLCASVCEDLRLIREKNIELSWQLEEGVTIVGNKELLQRLLVNLITNAYRYGKEHGHIQVELKQTQTEVRLSVADDGRGIAQEQLAHIWQRFYQADASRSKQGSGLGLAMVQEIAQLHHGCMKVESVQGKGSCFTFCIPLK
ncbi:sensor histidine kinase [[Clostridium] innocuum]|uniref:histidine kinase n=2 Tax=Bacillota TaxID=1239 RepID=A0A3E2VXI4_CLOIN|nr:HAMP domain-containing sensor histidine kinase [[Clostridium] innocuum]RGC16051.1 sensor histidine kinase [[Clostridium] innocuum]